MDRFGRLQQLTVSVVSWPSRADRLVHDGPVTLWRQVIDVLAGEIASGELRAGARLPGEVELAEIYGVSRITIRRAVAELAKQDKVTVVHGRGTFVTAAC